MSACCDLYIESVPARVGCCLRIVRTLSNKVPSAFIKCCFAHFKSWIYVHWTRVSFSLNQIFAFIACCGCIKYCLFGKNNYLIAIILVKYPSLCVCEVFFYFIELWQRNGANFAVQIQSAKCISVVHLELPSTWRISTFQTSILSDQQLLPQIQV